jgi:alkanesulfonate monooxygenase SsuD/methylene tetrahydromethanopterin reductase-like flavin-dependent oxidoreductase (luciferase family)
VFIMYFTEQPMSTYPAAEAERHGTTVLTFPNKHFDPIAGSRLYQQYLSDYLLAEKVGFDGIMLNEHHNGAYCMQAKTNIFASVLAGTTKKVKIVPLGNPLPLSENPIRLAEELAMIDMISGGRLVSGFVRGGGQEQLAAGVNPAFNRQRFEEAHDLIVKTWTQSGPFRWEGEHYQQRVVNPWVLPLQQPHPRIWVPGVVSSETITWAARHAYPYIALNTAVSATKKIWATYDAAAQQAGYTPGPEHRGYVIRVHVQRDEQRARTNALQFSWMKGEFTGVTVPVWASPSGYFSPSARRAFVEFAVGRVKNPNSNRQSLDQLIENRQLIVGTPKQAIAALREVLEATRPSIIGIWAADGLVSPEDTQECIRLLGGEVLPALRDLGQELGLNSPFDINAPVSLNYHRPNEPTQHPHAHAQATPAAASL